MEKRPRAHILRVLLTPAHSSASQVFNLDPGSRITHVALNIGAAGPPQRVSATLIQPRADPTVFNTLAGGWIRGSGSDPSTTGDLTWDGDIEIGTDMALRLDHRNDAGAANGVGCNFMVVE